MNGFRLQFNLRHLAVAFVGVSVACWWFLYQPAGIQKTGRELDVAIYGRGYFVFTHPVTNATLYTRRGELSINSQGQICVGPAAEGLLIEPSITIPPGFTSLSISNDGNVYFYSQGQQQAQNAGQLTLATFVNSDGLREVLPDFFEQTDDSGQPMTDQPGFNGAGLLQSGYLETTDHARIEATTLLLVILCFVVAWLAWEVRGLRLSLRPAGGT